MRDKIEREVNLKLNQVQQSVKSLWKELKELSRQKKIELGMKQDVSRKLQNLIGEWKDLIPSSRSDARDYMNRTGKKITRYFIRQNRIKSRRGKIVKEKAPKAEATAV